MFQPEVLPLLHGVNEKLDAVLRQQRAILHRLGDVQESEDQIMATEQQLLDAISKIDAATTKQGTVLTAEAATLQHVSDDVDKLIATAKGAGVADSTLAALQAQADKIQAVSDSLDQQAAFSTALASKADNPTPLPVPAPTP